MFVQSPHADELAETGFRPNQVRSYVHCLESRDQKTATFCDFGKLLELDGGEHLSCWTTSPILESRISKLENRLYNDKCAGF